MTKSSPARDHAVASGIGLRLASVGCYSIMAALLKLASQQGVVALEMLFYRAIFGLPVVLLWVIFGQGLHGTTAEACRRIAVTPSTSRRALLGRMATARASTGHLGMNFSTE